jgi:ribosomal protein S6E (S10)
MAFRIKVNSDGVRKLNKKTGKIIAEELKQLTSIIHDTQAQLTKTLLLSSS